MTDSKVTNDVANGSRILARQLARPLTEDEISLISGGMISHGAFAGAKAATTRLADTWSGTGCPENDSDC